MGYYINITMFKFLVLNLVFLKYAGVEELSKLLDPFIGENSKTWAYPPANLLMILDSVPLFCQEVLAIGK